ncbi:MAG: hypothetical protein B6I24_02100 [Bacteroidetes bacterium 4572_128]|nr:MAG: hypothetical protein B6I24_02100 [Bacteroidetes bacterium 4572_128]
MNLVYNNKFLEIYFEMEKSLIVFQWEKITEEASEEDFKEWNRNLVKMVEVYRPKFILSINIYYFFIINVELQEWSVKNIFEKFQAYGVKKLAMIESDDFISQISLEQFVDEGEELLLTKYFVEKEDAMKWFEK